MKPHIIASYEDCINNINLRTFVYSHILNPHLKCAVTGVKLHYKDKCEVFYGHSVSKDINRAVQSSKYEVLERIFCCDILMHTSTYNLYRYSNNIKIGHINREDISLRGVSDIGATGLSCHKSICEAKEHGLYEVLERHILSSMWYGDLILHPIQINEPAGDGLTISSYSTAVPSNFCISVLRNNDNTMFFSGSAISDEMEKSIEKSRNEAFMLINNYYNGELHNLKGVRKSSAENIKRLVGLDAKIINEHFDLKVHFNDGSVIFKKLDIESQLHAFGFSLNDASYAIVRDEEGFFITKSFLHNALSKECCRQERGHILHDPFC